MSEEAVEDIPDEVFEINDFTVFSDMERLVVSIEATLQEWELTGPRRKRKYPKGLLSQCGWSTAKSTRISFGDHNQLRLSFIQPDLPEDVVSQESTSNEEDDLPALLSDLASTETDFVSRNNIAAMYGVTEYLLFTPERTVEDQISTEDQKNLMLSAIRTAAQSSECEIAMLVQYADVDRQLFLGCASHRHVQSTFTGSQLRRLQARHTHLSGLLALFKEEVKCPISHLDAEDIRISIMFEYSLGNASLYSYSQYEASPNQIDVIHLPMGSIEDPLEELSLLTSWPNMKEEIINENEVYSDLEPQSAFHWAAHAKFFPTDGILTSTLSRFLQLPRSSSGQETVKMMLGLSINEPGAQIFGQLTGDSHSVKHLRIGGVAGGMGSVVPSLTNPGGLRLDELPLPIEKKVMDEWMKAVFGGTSLANSPEEETKTLKPLKVTPGSAARTKEVKDSGREKTTAAAATEEKSDDQAEKQISEQLKSLKTVPEGDSLSSRLVRALLHSAVEESYGPCGLAQMWLAFVHTLRWHFDWNKDIEGIRLNASQPDLSRCLLHQKLEMLQLCIEARRKRHELYDKAKEFHTDEFFDAHSDIEEEENEQQPSTTTLNKETEASQKEKDYSAMEPQGRLHPLGDNFLLAHPNIPLFIPITQERAPMTEDMLEEYSRRLTEMEDEQSRLEAQLDTLNSDMQAFKAANPKASFLDFIRWHSPKDWIEETGSLSERMQLQDNVWQRCWKDALPIPVVNQARLFNETQIAEEILSHFESATMARICELATPPAFALAAQQLIQDSIPVADLVDIDKLTKLVQNATRTARRDDYLEALSQMKKIERVILYYRSAYEKLSRAAESSRSTQPTTEELRHFINSLILSQLQRGEKEQTAGLNVLPKGIQIFGGASSSIGTAVGRLLNAEDGKDGRLKQPNPIRRFYTFHWNVPSPTKQSLVLPQRMFAAIEYENCRINGTFVRDTVFFADF